jgi:hypothetical protein
MKKIIPVLILTLTFSNAFSQDNKLYQTGLTAEQNLEAIGNLARRSAGGGGVGFDTRYEGVKGSPRLFEKLLPSLLKIKGQDYYIKIETDLDVTGNSLIFADPKTGKLLTISSDLVEEVKITSEGHELQYLVTRTGDFEKEFKVPLFYQVLKPGQYSFIRIPIKKLIAADFKDPYSADRRYDEYTTYFKYYIRGTDSIYHPVQLSKKSLIKFFPDKKDLINRAAGEKSYDNDEEMVLSILNKF